VLEFKVLWISERCSLACCCGSRIVDFRRCGTDVVIQGVVVQAFTFCVFTVHIYVVSGDM
jgi:hypothetical protein